MKRVRIIDRRDMVLRFARGELHSSEFFPVEWGFPRDEIARLLNSSDPDEQDQGMTIIRLKRWNVLQSIPYSAKWEIAEIDVRDVDFGQIKAINDPGWNERTQPTGLLKDAIVPLHPSLAANQRIQGIRSAIRTGSVVQWEGITLTGPASGPFELKEGHGRLVALSLECQANPSIPSAVEVALGTW